MDKKDQIITVALKLFAKNGFEKTSVSAICEEAEVSKGLVFHHFKNKNELLREVFNYISKIIDETDDSYLAVKEPKARLETLIEAIFTGMAVPEHRAIYQFNFNVMVQPTTRALLIDLIDERMDGLRAGVEEVFEYLGHQQPAVISRMFVAEIDGIALNYLLNDDFPLEAVKQEFIKKYC
ncbi:TetR/AcrR family transcriptional regulator [Vibrio rhodolitus]|uniref:TetR/AcrR family transcriptional regulator n=1 Tax=Vibrio rhodolitus TaxID=2231649 RepID=UPI000E0BD4F8|nr:TetR/AcrR family transcriptional regulator [Vibrio rhodolitus]